MSRRTFIDVIIVVLVLHILLGRLPISGLTSRTAENRPEKDKPIEITPYREKNTDKPVVQTDRVEETEQNKDEKARFSGEFRNRTQKETQSPIRGKFSSGNGAPKFPELGDQKKKGTLGMADLMPFGASPQALPDDIVRGNETVVNTDEFRYASFYNRFADKIYGAWTDEFRRALEELKLRGVRIDRPEYVTRLVITMNREGEVSAIELTETCGITLLDDAAKKAIFQNSPFEHPPTQMLSTDGFIHFRYGFVVQLFGGPGLSIRTGGA